MKMKILKCLHHIKKTSLHGSTHPIKGSPFGCYGLTNLHLFWLETSYMIPRESRVPCSLNTKNSFTNIPSFPATVI